MVEVFGEPEFVPVNKKEAVQLSLALKRLRSKPDHPLKADHVPDIHDAFCGKVRPVNKKEAVQSSRRTEKCQRDAAREISLMAQEFVRQEETSFTIIAFPLP